MAFFPPPAQAIMIDRFGRDSLISLATTDGLLPSVRTVNGYYEDGCFYVVTHARSCKMKQITQNPHVAICGDWFTAHGLGENMGHILDPQNARIAQTLRDAFAAWYHNGHTNEADPNTIILRIQLIDGILFSRGTRYEIKFI